MDAKNAIKVENLTAAYGFEVILKNINFNVSRGEIFVVAGGSGCGKSTLLKNITGLAKTVSGRVTIAGKVMSTEDGHDLSILKKIGVLFQGGALIGSMTIADNVALPIREHLDLPKKCVRDMARMKLELVGLAEYENYFPSQLSGGMKKRAALARAMALNPEILFLDEPSSGLDPPTSAEIDELILKINSDMGATMFIITHELASIFSIAKRVVMLDKKKKGIIAEGDPRFLKSNSKIPEVIKFFNSRASAAPIE